MSATTFSKWKNGQIKSFSPQHSIFPVLEHKMRGRARELDETADAIEAWRKGK
jgi:hypothetical protein